MVKQLFSPAGEERIAISSRTELSASWVLAILVELLSITVTVATVGGAPHKLLRKLAACWTPSLAVPRLALTSSIA